MDIQGYISSGLLESFVLGLTTAEETQEVLRLMEQYPDVRDEITAIEEALIKHAEAHVALPSSRIKEKLFKQLGDVKRDGIITHPASAAMHKGNGMMRFLMAASVTLFFLSAAVNFYLYSNWKEAEQQIVALNSEKDQFAQEFNIQQTRYKVMENSMAVLQSPFSKLVILKGMPVSPNSLAMVYWNTQTHEVFINTRELPQPPEGKQYQLWALADGKPIDAGVFDVTDSTHMQKLKVISSAQAFAVTLENTGGNPTPTLSAMYLMGSI